MSLGFVPSFLARTVAAGGVRRSKRLIAIFQRGAVDGLSVVVPHGDADYYRARPGLAVARPGSGENAALPTLDSMDGNRYGFDLPGSPAGSGRTRSRPLPLRSRNFPSGELLKYG